MTTVKCYTIEETAEILKLSISTVRAYIKSGKIKAARIGTRWRITEAEIDRLLEVEKA